MFDYDGPCPNCQNEPLDCSCPSLARDPMEPDQDWPNDPRRMIAKLEFDTSTVDLRDMFELDMITAKVEDLWRVVFGPDKPMPKVGTPWAQALSQIQGACLHVRWEWMDRPKRPPLRLLPLGVEMDDE